MRVPNCLALPSPVRVSSPSGPPDSSRPSQAPNPLNLQLSSPFLFFYSVLLSSCRSWTIRAFSLVPHQLPPCSHLEDSCSHTCLSHQRQVWACHAVTQFSRDSLSSYCPQGCSVPQHLTILAFHPSPFHLCSIQTGQLKFQNVPHTFPSPKVAHAIAPNPGVPWQPLLCAPGDTGSISGLGGLCPS